MAASSDDISASTAELAEGFLNPASHGPNERQVKVKAQADVLMVIAKQEGVKTGREMEKNALVVSVVTVRARSTCLSPAQAPPYLLLLSSLLANCDICS
ncbi:hypothetical protein DPX16_10081 [Anabarilius grahami]|uniref:Uncharacterized protein n=1 Tax=Anabarilius grahami TaxID=495550 RepID=A0A3N0XXD7_ANAGA|nr:hypothetical protein DPX16_10081 [Anabarilius grahami]